MGIRTKRVRDTSGNGAIAQLDLSDADAADRRLDVLPADVGAKSLRIFGFTWTKSTTQATDISIFRVDTADSDRAYLIEKRTADTGTSGKWRPDLEEVSGADTDAPSATGIGYRIEFSQAGGACLASVTADFKEVN